MGDHEIGDDRLDCIGGIFHCSSCLDMIRWRHCLSRSLSFVVDLHATVENTVQCCCVWCEADGFEFRAMDCLCC